MAGMSVTQAGILYRKATQGEGVLFPRLARPDFKAPGGVGRLLRAGQGLNRGGKGGLLPDVRLMIVVQGLQCNAVTAYCNVMFAASSRRTCPASRDEAHCPGLVPACRAVPGDLCSQE